MAQEKSGVMISTALKNQFFTFAVLTIFVSGCADTNPKISITDIKSGSGIMADRHMHATIHSTGWTAAGTKLESSRDKDQPLSFIIDSESVIPGLNQGLKGMRVGGMREITIPPQLAYGQKGLPPKIPPNTALKYEIELLDLSGPSYTNISNNELKVLIDRGVPLIDIRREEEWAKTGIIKGSILITAFDKHNNLMPSFFRHFANIKAPQDEVALICRTGNRTSVLAHILTDRLNHNHIYNVQHGITKWIDDKNPIQIATH